MAIGTRANFKSFAGISASDTSEDSKIDIIITGVDAAIKRHLGIDVESTSYPGAAANGTGDDGYYSGNGHYELLLRQYPVQTITSIYVDPTGYFGTSSDPFASATLLTAGTDYALQTDGCLPGTSTKVSYKGSVVRIGNVWPGLLLHTPGQINPKRVQHKGNIKIAYTAGYTTVPGDIIMAFYQMCAWVRSHSNTGMAVQSEKYEEYAITLATGAINSVGSFQRTLARYKRVV